jgi:hypothetical protein
MNRFDNFVLLDAVDMPERPGLWLLASRRIPSRSKPMDTAWSSSGVEVDRNTQLLCPGDIRLPY